LVNSLIPPYIPGAPSVMKSVSYHTSPIHCTNSSLICLRNLPMHSSYSDVSVQCANEGYFHLASQHPGTTLTILMSVPCIPGTFISSLHPRSYRCWISNFITSDIPPVVIHACPPYASVEPHLYSESIRGKFLQDRSFKTSGIRIPSVWCRVIVAAPHGTRHSRQP
jgi:hypothetical protein